MIPSEICTSCTQFGFGCAGDTIINIATGDSIRRPEGFSPIKGCTLSQELTAAAGEVIELPDQIRLVLEG